jgi:hypothetical protein
LREKLDSLPPQIQKEAMDYIEFLVKKYRKRSKKGPLNLRWAGSLADLKGEFTSVELQHKASEWR